MNYSAKSFVSDQQLSCFFPSYLFFKKIIVVLCFTKNYVFDILLMSFHWKYNTCIHSSPSALRCSAVLFYTLDTFISHQEPWSVQLKKNRSFILLMLPIMVNWYFRLTSGWAHSETYQENYRWQWTYGTWNQSSWGSNRIYKGIIV